MKQIFILVAILAILLSGCNTSEKSSSAQESSEPLVSFGESEASSNSLQEIANDVNGSVSYTEEQINYFDAQAKILTEHLIRFSFLNTAINGKVTPEKLEINSFVLSIPLMRNETYIYNDFVKEGALYEYPEDRVQQIVFELFGIKDWKLEGSDLYFNEELRQYETGLEYGIGGFLSLEDMQSVIDIDEGTITVQFMLTDSNLYIGETGWKKHGDYAIKYKMISAEKGTFLRFHGMEKIR